MEKNWIEESGRHALRGKGERELEDLAASWSRMENQVFRSFGEKDLRARKQEVEYSWSTGGGLGGGRTLSHGHVAASSQVAATAGSVMGEQHPPEALLVNNNNNPGDHRAMSVDEDVVVYEEPGGTAGGVRKGRIYKKGAWTVPEVMVLQAAKREDFERNTKGCLKEKHKTAQERWLWIEDICWSHAVQRSAQQCQDKWESLVPEFKKVLDYERHLVHNEHGQTNQKSYWLMIPEERKKTPKLPPNLPKEVFNALLEWYLKSKTVEHGGGGELPVDNSTPPRTGNSSSMGGSNGEFSGIEGEERGPGHDEMRRSQG
ncbi:hypothetical protein R1flu_021194 [Riccia fluitans]|uniref:Myb-like domain-containing protein n=1 Tax=Riccia fluitans TaxID=41844 RepID=A0ABD1ZQA4_9MARC